METLLGFYKAKRWYFLIISLFVLSMQINAQAPSHDPSRTMKDGNRYWVFYTHYGIGAISSSDPEFKDWQTEPNVFGNTWPSWINNYVSGFTGTFWAPSCIYMNNQYYLFYACSTFGSSVSAIGVATSPSLNNPSWTDHGMVVHSAGGSSVINAIDPAIFKDDDGKVWMTYGSWFGGIAVVQLDSVTGKPVTGVLTHVAGGNSQDYEGSFLMKHDGYYYLFVNRGLCCQGVNSTYYIQVGRSTSVTGTYSGWRTFLQTDRRFIGPGHVGYNEGRLTYHIYDRDDDGASKLVSTTLHWTNGWPVADKPSQAAPGSYIPNGTYKIMASDTTKIIGVSNNSPGLLANVQLWDNSNTLSSGQSWDFSKITLNQYKISPANYSTLSFDLLNCLGDDGTNLDLWSYWGGNCQKWTLDSIGNNTYLIRSVLSNKPIKVDGAVIKGANILEMANDPNDITRIFKLKLLKVGAPTIYSYTSQQNGNPASNLIDGNTTDDSRWSAEFYPQSVVIDYGENKSISGVKVWTYLSRAYQYTVEFSDKLDFSNPYIVDRSSNTSTTQPITDNFTPIKARYAKLTVTGASGYTGNWASIDELQIVENTSGLNNIGTENPNVAIYPNPANNVLNINLPVQLSSGAKFVIYNAFGQEMYSNSQLNGSKVSLNISNLQKGIYIVVVSKETNVVSKRFIKE